MKSEDSREKRNGVKTTNYNFNGHYNGGNWQHLIKGP